MKKFIDMSDTRAAVIPLNTSTQSGAWTTIPINATGYGRAQFTFIIGTPSAAGSIYASIWNASTSGATFTSIAGAALAQVSTGIGSQVIATIDTVLSSASPWLIVSGGTSTYWPVAVVCDLYDSATHVQAATPQQIVVV